MPHRPAPSTLAPRLRATAAAAGSRTSGWWARLRAVPTGRLVLAGVVVAALVVGAVAFWPRQEPVRVTAEFVRAVGLFPGSDVRILGVRVGEVTSVQPSGDRVRVGLEFTPEHPVPADAQAAVVAPSLVSDRYVQLLPVYTDGPRMESGATIPLERTAVPVELDRVSRSLDDLMVALGPRGANDDGALSRVLETGAANLDGNGAALHETNANLSRALQAFADGRGDLFGTVQNLDVFAETLAANDNRVRRLNRNLADVTTALDDERDDLSSALANLAVALDEVSTFVHDNRTVLRSDVARLTEVTTAVRQQRAALAETLDNAPVALSNLQLAYNPSTGTLDTRSNLEGVDEPGLLLCSLITGNSGTGDTRLCKDSGLLDLRTDELPLLGGALSNVRLDGPDPTLGGLL